MRSPLTEFPFDALDTIMRRFRQEKTFAGRFCASPADVLRTVGFDAGRCPHAVTLPHVYVDPIDWSDLSGFHDTPATRAPREALLLESGIKDVALFLGTDAEMRDIGGWALHRGFTALLSPLHYGRPTDVGKGTYSNRLTVQLHISPRSDSRRALIVGRDTNDAALAWLSLVLGWHAFLGLLLGYPECCVDAFVDRWPTARRLHQGDLATLTILRSGSGPFDWRVNILSRYFGYQLIQHFPCHFACGKSINLARRVHDALQKHDPRFASELTQVQNAPVLYTDYCGVFIFRDAKVSIGSQEWALHFDPARVLATDTGNALAQVILSLDVIVGSVVNDILTIGEDRANGYLVRFANGSDVRTSSMW